MLTVHVITTGRLDSADIMNIHLKAQNDQGELYFERSVAVNPVALIDVAKSREQLAREKGRVFTEGAIPFFGAELLKAAQSEGSDDLVHRHAADVAMAAWLAGSIYEGLSESEFTHSNLHFTMRADGTVKYSRIPKP